jgi:hypothetical protein
MKKTALLAAMLCLFAVGIFAQAKPDFSGTWTLDKGKSKLPENARIESMTIKATQTASDLTVETTTKREPRPEGAGGGMGGQGGGGGRGMGGGMMGGDGTTVFKIDGSETTTEIETRMGKMPVKSKAMLSASSLETTTSRTFNTPNGEMTMTTKENWTLADGGKTLKIVRTSTTPQGERTTEMVYTKN